MRKVRFLASFLAVFMTLDLYMNDGATIREGVRALNHAASRLNEKLDSLTKPVSPGS